MSTHRRGSDHPRQVGAVRLLWRSGVDTPATTPAYDLTAGELFVFNGGSAPVTLRYNSSETFLYAFRFTFGANAEKSFSYTRPCGEEQFAEVTLAPKERLLVGRMDFMWLVGEVTVAGLVDGVVTTFYETLINIDNHSEELKLGPHRFKVALERDWQAERAAYDKLLAAT